MFYFLSTFILLYLRHYRLTLTLPLSVHWGSWCPRGKIDPWCWAYSLNQTQSKDWLKNNPGHITQDIVETYHIFYTGSHILAFKCLMFSVSWFKKFNELHFYLQLFARTTKKPIIGWGYKYHGKCKCIILQQSGAKMVMGEN